MANTNIQQGIVALEQGKLGFIMRVLALVALLIALVVINLFFHFRGLGEASVMNQAQIARNISQGKGFTTNVITPRALAALKATNKLQENNGSVDISNLPDALEAPLLPYVYSVPMRFMTSWEFDMADKLIYPGDRLMAFVSLLFLLGAAIVWYFVVRRLFDERIALLTMAALFVTDILWLMALEALPQGALMMFFGLAILATLRAEEEQERGNFFLTAAFLCLGAVAFSLMMLTHGAAGFIFAGWLIFVGFFFVPRGILAVVPLIVGVLCLMWWMMRNYLVCGNPLGLAFGGIFYSPNPYGDYLRYPSCSAHMSAKALISNGIPNQLGALIGYLGLNVVAIAFFFTILHKFRNPTTAMFRWGFAIMWVVALLGMCFFRPAGAVSMNQFHVLFLPAFIAYGFAFLLVLWGRWNISSEFLMRVFLAGLIILCALPLGFRLLSGTKNKIQWPPYFPHVISMLSNWYGEQEIIASDIPCGVAWYAQRHSLLMPATLKQFTTMHDYRAFQQPISALYLTPASMDKPLYTGIYQAQADWAPIILRPPQTKGFSLPVFTPLPIGGMSALFTDRPRWTENRTAPTVDEEEKETSEK